MILAGVAGTSPCLLLEASSREDLKKYNLIKKYSQNLGKERRTMRATSGSAPQLFLCCLDSASNYFLPSRLFSSFLHANT